MTQKYINKYTILQDVTMEYAHRTLYRIKALRDFGDVKTGDFGGWIESEDNLSQYGNCWIYDYAIVYGKARISNNAQIRSQAEISGSAKVYQDAIVGGQAQVMQLARIYGNAEIYGTAQIMNRVKVYGNACVSGDTLLHEEAKVYGNARVYGEAIICGSAEVYGKSCVFDTATVYGLAKVYRNAKVCKNAKIRGNAKVRGHVRVSGFAIISGDAVIESSDDYITLRNNWSSGRYFTYTRSNQMYRVGCFYGTADELIAKAYKDSKLSGDCYKASVQYIQALEQAFHDNTK